ncbi:Uncharacterized protein P5673_000479 [Acropora cervicornis]|uniref:LITAF domain-containing protein n=1 Tax=Acropora cervicornis TaxID=6130 RepID=A0AAD9R7J9_ACRCE|nr:Uncharacterized protein P5673_000479 [Acropora cervicornis]
MAAQAQNYAPNQGQYPPNYPPQHPGYYQPTPPAGAQYPPPQQPYYPGVYYPPQQTTVIQQQPVVLPQPIVLKQFPVSMQCPHCGATIVTKLDHRVGNTSFVYCCILSMFCCCCIPFFTQCAKDVAHMCPNCHREIGVFKRPLVESGGGSGGTYKRGANYDFHYGGPGDDYVPPSDD